MAVLTAAVTVNVVLEVVSSLKKAPLMPPYSRQVPSKAVDGHRRRRRAAQPALSSVEPALAIE